MIKRHNSRLIYLVAVFLLTSLIIALMVGVLGAYNASSFTEATNTVAGDPDWIGQSDKADSYYGEAVRSAGDVNGDGYDDAIVGAVNYDAPGGTDAHAHRRHRDVDERLLPVVRGWQPPLPPVAALLEHRRPPGGDGRRHLRRPL